MKPNDIIAAFRAGRLHRRDFLRAAVAAGLSMSASARILAEKVVPVPVRSTRDSAAPEGRVDYIIVGGGSAGCVLAHRLSHNPDINVVVLEAGGWVDDPAIDNSLNWPTLQGGSYDWAYETVGLDGLDGRVLPYPRGRGFGGSSLINATGHQRGAAPGWDRWQELGADGWTGKAMLPYHRRSETYSAGADDWRGDQGPLDVLAVSPEHAHPAAGSFFEAADSLGYAWTDDFNGERWGDCAWNQFTIAPSGVREHAARAFLESAVQRPNLTLLGDARVLGLDIESGRCVGARYLHGDEAVSLRASRGVIMAAGAIDTPRLLLLSGLGPAADLKRLGIEVAADLPGIGANLHDHPLIGGVAFESVRPLPLSRYNHGEGMLVVGRDGASGGYDLMIMCVTVPFVIPSLGTAPANTVTLIPCLMQPRSRGTLTLSDADPMMPAVIDPATYRDSSDLDAIANAVALCRELGNSDAMSAWAGREIFADMMGSPKQVHEFIRRGTSSFYHPVGTVRMGADSDAPLQSDLRLKGVDGLWVADASVMPAIVPAMTNAAVIAVAERASDLVLNTH